MAFFLLFAFIGMPILEIALLLKVGGLIGVVPTVALVLLTAAVGTWLLRAQGLSTLARARTSLERGEAPVREVFDGACLLVGGALLLTPGFVTDTLGFLLLLPPVRSALLTALKRSSAIQVHASGFGPPPNGPNTRGPDGAAPRGPTRGPGVVIDGDFEEVPPDAVQAEDLGPARPTRWGGTRPSPEQTDDTNDTDGPTPPRAE